MDPVNRQKNQIHPTTGWVLVAVMFDPKSRWHWASTVPRGKRWSMMRDTGPDMASHWSSAVEDGDYHAEDGVYYNYESSGKVQINTEPNQKPYPHGCMIAAHGWRYNRNTNELEEKADVPACTNRDRKNPTCQTIAQTLGVWYNKAGPENEYNDPELVDNDFLGVMCEWEKGEVTSGDTTNTKHRLVIRGRQVLAPRGNDTCAINGTGPTPVLRFSYTGTVESASLSFTPSIVTGPESSGGSSSAGSSTSSSSSASPKPSCYQQYEDPDKGINQEYCLCDGSRTLPFMTVTNATNAEASCDYTTLPPKDTKRHALSRVTSRDSTITTAAGNASALAGSSAHSLVTAQGPAVTTAPAIGERDLTVSTGWDPATTDIPNCQVCSQDSPYGVSCSKDWSLPSCTPPTAAVTLEAGKSSVHVGALTGTALSASVSSALEALCPTATAGGVDTACGGGQAVISGIEYSDEDVLSTGGELVVTVESSKYNETQMRDALIKTIATAAQQAAVGDNCYQQEVGVLERRAWYEDWLPSFLKRDHPVIYHEDRTWCNTCGKSDDPCGESP